MDFQEEQKMSSRTVVIFFAMGIICAMAGVAIMFFQPDNPQDDYTPFYFIPLIMIIPLGIAYLLVFRSTLETSVSSQGFTYRYPPFIRNPKTIAFEQVVNWKIRKISNIKESYGTGYQKNWFNSTTSLILGGDEVLELYVAKNKKFLFSTHSGYALSAALKKYIAKKEMSV